MNRRRFVQLGALSVTAFAAGCGGIDEVLDWVLPEDQDLELGLLQLAWDMDGNLYEVRPSDHHIARISDDGEEDFRLGNQTPEDGGMNYPTQLASTSNGKLVVVEAGGGRLAVYNQDGSFERNIGEAGSRPGQLRGASDAVVDSQGNIFVADSRNHRVQVFDLESGAHLWSFGQQGDGDGELNTPRSITIDQGNDCVLWRDAWLSPYTLEVSCDGDSIVGEGTMVEDAAGPSYMLFESETAPFSLYLTGPDQGDSDFGGRFTRDTSGTLTLDLVCEGTFTPSGA